MTKARHNASQPGQLDLWAKPEPLAEKPTPANPAPSVEKIREKLKTNSKWATKGVIAIWGLQTQEEKSINCTVQNNGVGFTLYDANVLSPIAWKLKNNVQITSYEMNTLFKRMPKYARQLHNLVLKKQAQAKEER